MDETLQAIVSSIFTIAVISFVLFVAWRCCRKLHPKRDIKVSMKKGNFLELLIKKSNQPSTKDIEDLIIVRLKKDYKASKLIEKAWEGDHERPVIVFCVISSRIGADIENAIRGVHVDSPVVLVILHCVLSSLLRGDLSDDEELLDTTLKNRMAGITHFAFSDREGLYDCHQNTTGFKKLLALINQLPKHSEKIMFIEV